jgi:hypothetical protein
VLALQRLPSTLQAPFLSPLLQVCSVHRLLLLLWLLLCALLLLLLLLQLGKKAARRAKRKSELDKEFEEAEAGPDLVELALLQSQMLEVRMIA